MKQVTCLCLWLLSLSPLAWAQSPSKYGLSLAYFGDKFTNAGLALGVENSLLHSERLQLIGAAEVGGFSVPGSSWSLFAGLRIGPRYTTRAGFFVDAMLNIGYQQVYYLYDRYRLNDAGNIVLQNPNTSGRAMPGVLVGLGYDWSKKTKLPVKLFGGLQVYFNYPTTHILFEASSALRAGVIVSPGFLNRKNAK